MSLAAVQVNSMEVMLPAVDEMVNVCDLKKRNWSAVIVPFEQLKVTPFFSTSNCWPSIASKSLGTNVTTLLTGVSGVSGALGSTSGMM